MTSSLSRRSALTAISGAAVAVPAMGLAAHADPDAELRRLWIDYQRLAKVADAAHQSHLPFRAAADAKIEEIRSRNLPWAEERAAEDQLREEPNVLSDLAGDPTGMGRLGPIHHGDP